MKVFIISFKPKIWLILYYERGMLALALSHNTQILGDSYLKNIWLLKLLFPLTFLKYETE